MKEAGSYPCLEGDQNVLYYVAHEHLAGGILNNLTLKNDHKPVSVLQLVDILTTLDGLQECHIADSRAPWTVSWALW